MNDASGLFTSDVVDAVSRHMNDDHASDNIVICQALGRTPDATAATMTGLDATGLFFEVTGPSGTTTATIPWAGLVTERHQIRAEVADMYHRACEQLGIAPAAGEHESPPADQPRGT